MFERHKSTAVSVAMLFSAMLDTASRDVFQIGVATSADTGPSEERQAPGEGECPGPGVAENSCESSFSVDSFAPLSVATKCAAPAREQLLPSRRMRSMRPQSRTTGAGVKPSSLR